MSNKIKRNMLVLPITRIKIGIAKMLYKVVKLFFPQTIRKITRHGIHYEVDLSEGIDLSLFLFGNFQSHVIQNKYLSIKPDDVIIDVGGNFGIMALQFAKAASRGMIYSFEPTHYALSKFNRNLDLNPDLKQRIVLINSFVSETSSDEAKITAFSSWKVSGKESAEELKHPVHLGTAKSTQGVGSVSLDDFMSSYSLQKVDIIKIDTDGHEFMVFNGARKMIETLRPKIIFEVGQYVMEEKGIDFSFYLNYFSSMNYSLFDTESGKNISADNALKVIPKLGTIDIIALPK